MTRGESAEVMRRWAALAPMAGAVTWTPVQAMIKAAEAYGRDWEGRVLEAAEKYRAKLGDLGDPLSVKMTWIERSYEPAYSRWLAWVLEQLGSSDAVWRVLGLADPPAEVRKLRTRAEVEIPPEGRLDIVVDCDGAPRVVIETKLRSAEECFLDDQLGRYKKQVDDGHAKGVLIVLDAERDSYEGFVVRRWKDVCVGLRRELFHVARGKHLGVAMILAFVGAVEQNLLGFPSLDSLATSPMLNPRVAAHIEESIEGDCMTADSASTQRNKLLEDGANSYPKAMYALSEFRGMVQDVCIAAMKKSLSGLSDALRLPLEKVQRYAAPDKPAPGEIDDTWAELGAILKKPGGARCALWNYIRWRDDAPLSVAVSIGFDDAGVAERAWAAVRDHETWKYDEAPHEIHLSKAADLARLGLLLDEMNSEWIKGWQKVGGVKQFLRKR